MNKNLAGHLCVDDTVDEILKHPAFAGFSRLLLPWDGRRYDTSMPLRNIGSVLPYHNHVKPGIVVESLNRLIDDASLGRSVFSDFYTDTEKQADPSRKDTGLFFFKGKPGAPFAVVAPGGGFAYVGSLHEGFPYAVEISNRGLNAFVPMGPHGSAVRPCRSQRHSSSLYTGHSDHASIEPPTFVAVGEADGIAPPAIMERRVAALRRSGTDVEYHKYPGVAHGFGLGVGTSAEGWIADAVRFWARQIVAMVNDEPIRPSVAGAWRADRLTHVMLLDRDRPAPYVFAVSHGADKVQALLNLWGTLIENHALPEAIDYVAVAYTRRTGKAPGKSTS